jgi:transcriptional regulator
MKPETIIYRLRLKGYTLTKLAKELETTRQAVWYVIHEAYFEEETQTDKIRTKIKEIISS